MDSMINQCKKRATSAMDMFLRNLSHVPVDKLDWSPAPTAKSALQIAAHCAGYSHGFARILREGVFPATAEDFLGPINSDIESVKTIDEAVAMLRAGIDETLKALDALRPEQIDSVLEAPNIGSTPFLFFMTIPSVHLVLHTGQIDYLQTCWGDMEIYIG